MIQKMLVISGSLDGQWEEWDDKRRVMSAVSINLRPVFNSDEASLVAESVPYENYYVEHLRVNSCFLPFLIFSKLRNPDGTVEAEDILRHLLHGYRKPNPCPECHKEPAECPYCGYGEATA